MSKIAWFEGLCLTINNATGPVLVMFPLLFQEDGLLIPLGSLLAMFVLSSLCSTMLVEAMQRIPHNHDFALNLGYVDVVGSYFPEYREYISWAYNISLLVASIASSAVASAVMDSFLQYLQLCQCDSSPSLGLLVCALICVPMGFLKLSENSWLQVTSAFLMVACTIIFGVQSLLILYDADPSINISERTPLLNDQGSQATAIGIALFAFAYVMTVPSWVNEKKHSVSVNETIWVAAIIGIMCKLCMTVLPSWAYDLAQPVHVYSDNILNVFTRPDNLLIARYAGFLWSLAALVPGIPVLQIIVRYELVSPQYGALAKSQHAQYYGFLITVLVPWIVTGLLYRSKWLLPICNWIALVLLGMVNFIIPVVVYRASQHAILTAHVDEHAPLISYETSTRPKPEEMDVVALPGWFTRHVLSPVMTATILIWIFVALSLFAIFMSLWPFIVDLDQHIFR